MKNYLTIWGMIFGLLISHASIAADKIAVSKAAQDVATRQLKTVQQAQLLVQTGKFAEAYALLQPMEFDLSGDIAFDYLLGISAVNTGKPDRATLALERVEAISPEYGDVRLWLGIAYFQSNDMARAKKSFTNC
jgi:predicted Zn-dependent protease